MVLKMILDWTRQHYDDDNNPTIWKANFKFRDSPNEVWEKEGSCDVTAIVTASDGFTTAGGIRDDTIAECKDFVQNKGNYAGGAEYANKHDTDTWA